MCIDFVIFIDTYFRACMKITMIDTSVKPDWKNEGGVDTLSP